MRQTRKINTMNTKGSHGGKETTGTVFFVETHTVHVWGCRILFNTTAGKVAQVKSTKIIRIPNQNSMRRKISLLGGKDLIGKNIRSRSTRRD